MTKKNSLVERLRELARWDIPGFEQLLPACSEAADEIERLEKHSRLGWNYAREVEDEYEKRMGHRFGSPQVELASSHQAVEQAISDSKNHKTKW